MRIKHDYKNFSMQDHFSGHMESIPPVSTSNSRIKKNRLDQEQYHQETAFSGNSYSKRSSERVEEPTKESEFTLSQNHGRHNHFLKQN